MKKKALIITDGTDSIHSIAKLIKDSLLEFDVIISSAQNFDGTDLLAADVFFIGCKKAKPSSFAYLVQMLSHINLASRKCGVFSVKEKTLKYLCKILKDCEADTGAPLYVKSKKVPKLPLKNCVDGITGLKK